MGGKKKGGSSHTPVEAKETGRSYQVLRMLEVISEGEIEGLVDDMRSVYLDKTPLCNKDGTFNFKNISVYANAGTQDQDVLQEFASVEKEIDVGTKILKDKPLIRTVTDVNVNRIRMTLGVERLLKQEDNGDTNPTSVSMVIEVVKNNNVLSSRTHTFNGKYSSAYREMFDLSTPKPPFSIRVTRVEPDSLTNKLSNSCFWSSYTEIIDKEFAYPNTALVGIKIDSEYFSNVPVRNYEIDGLIVKVPSNYDAKKHIYTSDFWDGSFKLSWTNNPAWVFYDLVTNTRYGMGKRLQDFNIDKWQLYAIGKYCDELVPDGFGGTEPRMTCNIWITDQRKAYDLINDICSIFRAMPVWNGQALTAIQDRKADPVWTYNNANTIGGFTRQRSAKKARHNVIEVEYIDASDFYEKKIESVSDDALVTRYGLNSKKVTAFGCTSRGQAYRTGRWLLETEKLETETISFTVGQEGVMHLPYDVIEIADSQYAGVNVGGRVLAVNGTELTLDRSIEVDDKSYLSYVSAKGVTENVKITSFDKQTNTVTVAKNLNDIPELTVWGLSTKRVTTGLYRAISIKENDNAEGKTYTITALQHVPEKEDIVVNGTHFDPKPQTIYGDVLDAEINYDGSRLSISGKVNGSFNVLTANSVGIYTVKLLKDSSLVYIEKGLKSPDINVDNLENGNYEAQIFAYNEKGQLLSQYTRAFIIDRPPVVTNISVVGHLSNVILTWDFVDDTTQTEIWCSETDDINSAKLVERIIGGYYSHEIGAKQVRYYWLRHKRGVNVGSFDQVQGRRGESGIDIQAELDLLNKELSENIITEIIDTALPARKLGMTKYVDNLDVNIYQGQNQVYDETSNKMYTWNGTKYVPLETELLASKIKGIIQPDQLAPIPTTNLKGTLTDAQIQSISATKLVGNISIAQVPNVPTSKLIGTIADNQIANINASKLQGTVPLDRLPTVPTSKLSGQITDAQLNSVSASKINGTLDISKVPNIPTNKLTGTVGANQISANSIGTNHLGANVVTAEKLSAGSVNSQKIASNTIESGHIKSNAIGANHITAGAITASKMVLYGENMILDPRFEDKAYWRENMAVVNDAIWRDGKIIVNFTDKSVTTGTYFYGLRQRINLPLDRGRSYRLQCRIKVTGTKNIDLLSTSAYLCSYPATTPVTLSTGWNNVATTAKFGVRDELVSCSFGKFKPDHNQIGVYLRIGCKDTGDVISGTVEFSELELIKMSDAELIVDGSITADKISSNAVTTDKLDANAVTAQKIAGNAIESNHIKAGSIIAGKLASNSVVADNIATNAITAVKIHGGAITAEKLAVNSVGTNALQAGAISADKLQSNSITSAKIQAGAIRANHIATGEITTDKFVSGLGGNLLTNPIFANPTDGVPYGWRRLNNVPADKVVERECIQDPDRGLKKGGYLPNENVVRWHNLRTGSNNTRSGISQNVAINANTWYMISVYMGNNRCTNVQIYLDQRGSNGEYLGHFTKSCREGYTFDGITTADRVFIKFKAHSNAVSLDVNFFFYDAKANETSCYMILARPMLEECTEFTQEPSVWVNSGVTAIHGGSLVTGTITADKIGANQITSNHIVGGAISGDKIAGNTITGNKIQGKTIGADKINVSTLSALSANLGSITGGSIKIGSLNGNYGTYFEVNAQGGFRLIARDGSGGIELSSGARALKVWDGGNEVVRVGRLTG